MLLTYMPSYLSHNLHLLGRSRCADHYRHHGGYAVRAADLGTADDALAVEPFIILGSVALFALAIPAFILINSNVLGLIFAGLLMTGR